MAKRNYSDEYNIVIEYVKKNKDKINKGELNFLLGYAANLRSLMEKMPKDDNSFSDNISDNPTDAELKKSVLLALEYLVEFLGKGEETLSTVSTMKKISQMLHFLDIKGDDVPTNMLERMSYEIDMIYYMYDLPMRDDSDLPNYLKGRIGR